MKKLPLLAIILASFTPVVRSQEIIPCRCTIGLFDGRHGYVNKDDEIVTPLKHYGTLDPIQGYGRVTNKYQWGLIDSTGFLKVPVEFSNVGAVVNGDIALVSNRIGYYGAPNHWALYSISKQDTITGHDFQEISFYGTGSLFVYSKIVDGKRVRGILNREGKEMYQTEKDEYIYLNKPSSSGIFIHESNGQQTFIDSNGIIMFPSLQRGKCSNFYDGYGFICNSNGCFKIDVRGKLTALKFDEIVRSSPNGEFSIFTQNDLHGLVKYTGEVIVAPKYDEIFCRDAGSIIAKKSGQYVLIDSTGREVSEEYDWISYAQNGYFSVVKDEKHGLMDRSGKIIIDLMYDGTWNAMEAGVCAVKLDDKWGLIDFENNVLLPIEYHSLMARGNYIKYKKAQYGATPMQYAYIYKTKSGEVAIRKLDKHNAKPCVFE